MTLKPILPVEIDACDLASGHNNNKLFVIPSWSIVIVRLGLDQADRKWTDAQQGEFVRLVGAARTAADRGKENRQPSAKTKANR